MSKHPLSAEELRALVGERDTTAFLNPRNELYRERNMKADPPPREEAITLMAANPNLIRRPLLVSDHEVVYGFDELAFRRVLDPT